MTTYLVTGGAGFIGSALVRLLLSEDAQARVIVFDALTYAGSLDNLEGPLDDSRCTFVLGDIRDEGAVRAAFERFAPDVVVNAAAETHVDRSIADPGPFVSTNVGGTAVLLAEAHRAWKGEELASHRFVQMSTDEVYGSAEGEGLFNERSPLDPHSPYAASKASADLLALSYWTTYGLPVVITRGTNTYGPRQYPEKLVPKTIVRALCGERVPVYGDGLQVRDWLHVDDHCRAVLAAARAERPGEAYNVGARCERTNLEVIDAIFAALGQAGTPADSALIEHVVDRQGHDRRYGTDPSKMERELGWKPKASFEEAFEQVVRWYVEHPAWIEARAGADRSWS